MTTTTHKVKVQRLPAGGAVFPLPGAENLSLLWIGRGSYRLHLVSSRPGGFMTPVDHPSGHLSSDTLKAATVGAQAFIDAGREDNES